MAYCKGTVLLLSCFKGLPVTSNREKVDKLANCVQSTRKLGEFEVSENPKTRARYLILK